MSSFLQRLKSGASVVDNNAPPDSAGVVIRKLEKKVLSQPADQLGITFGNDAEVTRVTPRSAAAAANIPVGFMIFDVNGDYVENENQFIEAARKNVNLVIKLQSTAGISELIARVLRDEEMRASGEISESAINFDELLRTTPRFNFLSGDHPIFLRYNRRLKQAMQAAALIAQRTQEAELQRQKEIKERMRKALEEEQAAQKKKEEQEEAERMRKNASPSSESFLNSEPFLRIIRDESEFGQFDRETNKTEAAPVVDEKPSIEISGNLLEEALAAPEVEPPTLAPTDGVTPASAEELLALVGIPTDLPPPLTPSPIPTTVATPAPQAEETVSYVTLPAEGYTLCSGEKVISVIKRRTGPIPPPPPGKPPTMNTVVMNTVNAAPAKLQIRAEQSVKKYFPSERRYSDRKRSRSPASIRRYERRHSSRDESHRHHHHSSPSRRDHRNSRPSRHRR
ncbi:hypothetical protein ABB37_07391 [Leptomonas pyrrhocoris]|uniref:PDZ domain-containing protein n=1 Tax=Leptomonas pyrrhocoris TaxID=157538 RepID=A0A0M9FVV5_LEPPY|nr:hypothetical protein ABB37_07391 [Leptomonas pyrrhocoris]KPA77053.1 hypothetical protein ABB37_07391 [Leptomonas pyrrhocoris]|eukprot:XP_015655492.1 hypothetical protein ABB37_07391 [Leptomonas pyrrhocoris]